jgi:hypothetical protein
MKGARILLCALLAAMPMGAQDFLDCRFAAGWEQQGTKHQYVADNLFEYKDGAAEGYLSFGFVKMQGVTCTSKDDTLDIDVSEMADADSAYGMFAVNADPDAPVAKLGMGGQVQKQSATFAKGRYYVELTETATNPDKDDTAALKAFAAKIAALLEGRETPPAILDWFVPEDVVSKRMVPESVLGLSQLKHGYVAKYKVGQAFIVQEESPEAAAEVMKVLRARFEGSAPAQVGDEAFQATARYLDGICFFRKGKILAGYANLPSAQEAAGDAAKLAARLP